MIKYINFSIIPVIMKKLKITNLIKLYTLLILLKKEIHGYDLIKELKSITGQHISTSHVYPFLQELKKNKIISVKNTGKRSKKYYKLTKEGKKFINSLLEKCEILTYSLIKSKLEKCAHCNCEIYKGMYKEKIKNKTYTFCCTSCALSFKNK